LRRSAEVRAKVGFWFSRRRRQKACLAHVSSPAAKRRPDRNSSRCWSFHHRPAQSACDNRIAGKRRLYHRDRTAATGRDDVVPGVQAILWVAAGIALVIVLLLAFGD
jgi:hypothetical protein